MDGAVDGLEVMRIPDELETLPETMGRLGYRTFGIADNPNIGWQIGLDRGFDRFTTFENTGSDQVDAELASWAEEVVFGEGSWFRVPARHGPARPLPGARAQLRAAAGPQAAQLRTAAREVALPFVEAAHASEIRYCDERIREAFELLHVDEETVVIFASDHGEELLQRSDQTQHGFKLFSELTRVPLVIVDPTRPRLRSRVEANVSTVDLLPTLRDLLGDETLDEAQVRRCRVPDDAAPHPPAEERPVFSMRTRLDELGGGELRAVVRGDLELIERDPDVNGRGEVRWLFDLKRD
ncbi:sulfatase-like hydrolase/transferase [Engelhardtia mirabilis]|uniref:Sulfatase n=1 Tax=Engelhardtia mirabilis TaxID=2528011 RepID=A0A518BGE2_9BACT|nr:Sulfatase [Planctomycetes bacterium Pla133]QDV00379.1 Sulfatase [Planctomycetes bacterium Pla86]